MKTSSFLLASALCASFSCSVHAQIVAEETFDYPANSLLSATGSAPGWGTGWKANTGLTTDLSATYDVFSGSLSSNAYTSQGLSPVGNQLRLDGQTLKEMYRGLSSPVSWDADSTFYLSTLVRWSGNSSSGASRINFILGDPNISFGFRGDGSTNNEMRLAVRNVGDVFGSTNYAAAADDGNREATAFTYMLVLKVDTVSSGNDVISLKLYEPNDTLPTTAPVTWDVVNDGVQTGSIDYIGFNSVVFFGGRTIGFDEFRIGNSFADVTAIPEPTSVALMIGSASLLFYRRRRKS